MKLSVIALDYDGTITRDDRLDASMTDAIAEARRRGVAVMLVTGRRLDDLRRVAGKLDFLDGVVIRSVLPALNVMRRRVGTPHRIIVDEGHYFLRDAVKHNLLDLDFNGYTVVTYWPSQLPRALVAATEVILVTRESNRAEIDAVRQHCIACEHLDVSAWDVLQTLQIDQAAALPVTSETGSELQVFTIGERLTPHVRHRQKYVDVPVGDAKAFVFHRNVHPGMSRAHTLREFVTLLDELDAARAEGYLRRRNFSRWIADVFGDRPLARELQGFEREYVESRSGDAVTRIAAAIKSRYELTEGDDSVVV